MRFVCFLLAAAGLMFVAAGSARAASEVVVATRYLQATGTSHAHLYLYREDGKLLRRLTSSDDGQETDPIFAEDGESIVFTRLLKADVREFWTIEPSGRGLRKLEAAPDWYASAKSSPWFTSDEAEASTVATTDDSAPAPPAVFSRAG